MIQSSNSRALDSLSLKMIKLLMTVSLGVFSILFMYVIYNLVNNLAGPVVALLLFFITIAFLLMVLKVFKILHQFDSFEANDQLRSRNSDDNYSLPPPYEEVVKNQPIRTVSAVVPYQSIFQTVHRNLKSNNNEANPGSSTNSDNIATTAVNTVQRTNESDLSLSNVDILHNITATSSNQNRAANNSYNGAHAISIESD